MSGPSVWNTAPAAARIQRSGRYVPGTSAHPAKMLPAIAAHAVRCYSHPGELVLDPMCGIGTTLVEALHLGRHAIGVEVEPRWANLARQNTLEAMHTGAQTHGQVHCGDARNLTDLIPAEHHGKIALVVTSPPYGNSVHGRVHATRDSGAPGIVKFNHRYGHDPANLAHAGTDRLLAAFTEILDQCRRILRPGGTVVITTRPWRERGELIDLPTAVLAAGRHAGLIPTERCVALLAGIRDGHLTPRPSFFQMHNVREARRRGLPLHVVVHEDVIVFRTSGMSAAAHGGALPQGVTRSPRNIPCRKGKRVCTSRNCRFARTVGGRLEG
ncbi:TRM11 family SAM-dependent methyltransferase [Streptomyces boninensis]|uniref:TRM11 family SAM-dependent methyltransferase n=1 Tax=Streptomyces boninensis TaxID=2039455 RepID=UPI003B226621